VTVDTFDLLHVLRLKGIVPSDVVASLTENPPGEVATAMDALVSDGLVRVRETSRVTGWSLTEQGHERHAALMTASRTEDISSALAPLYERFLELNGRVKALSTSWQQLAPDNAAGRFEAIEELADIEGEAVQIISSAAAVVPRFRMHARRLGAAMDALRGGDERFFTGVTVDSFHTVWFECHEDLIQTLGRERVAEGSF
jgi:hypothetical protein